MRHVLPLRAVSVPGSIDPAAVVAMTNNLPAVQSVAPRVLGRTVSGMVPNIPRQIPMNAGRSILPRALHAMRRQEDPERAGAAVAGLAAQRAVARGFGASYGLGGLGGLGSTPACTGTGGRIAQEVLAGAGTLLTVLGATVGKQSTDGTMTTQQRNLAVAGASVSMVGGVYAGACEARTGTQTTSYASQAVQTSADIFAQIQSSRNGAQAATAQPGVSTDGTGLPPDQAAGMQAANAAAAANGNPNNAQPSGQQEAPPAASDNTTLYIAGGVVAAILLGALILK